jgi:hypothetical protein
MEENKTIQLSEEIKQLLGNTKKVMDVDGMAKYTGLSKSKIY